MPTKKRQPTDSPQSKTKPTTSSKLPVSSPEQTSAPPLASLLQQGREEPQALTPQNIQHLQRTVGNRAVGQLLTGSQSAPSNRTHNPLTLQDMVATRPQFSPPAVQLHRQQPLIIQRSKDRDVGITFMSPREVLPGSKIEEVKIPPRPALKAETKRIVLHKQGLSNERSGYAYRHIVPFAAIAEKLRNGLKDKTVETAVRSLETLQNKSHFAFKVRTEPLKYLQELATQWLEAKHNDPHNLFYGTHGENLESARKKFDDPRTADGGQALGNPGSKKRLVLLRWQTFLEQRYQKKFPNISVQDIRNHFLYSQNGNPTLGKNDDQVIDYFHNEAVNNQYYDTNYAQQEYGIVQTKRLANSPITPSSHTPLSPARSRPAAVASDSVNIQFAPAPGRQPLLLQRKEVGFIFENQQTHIDANTPIMDIFEPTSRPAVTLATKQAIMARQPTHPGIHDYNQGKLKKNYEYRHVVPYAGVVQMLNTQLKGRTINEAAQWLVTNAPQDTVPQFNWPFMQQKIQNAPTRENIQNLATAFLAAWQNAPSNFFIGTRDENRSLGDAFDDPMTADKGNVKSSIAANSFQIKIGIINALTNKGIIHNPNDTLPNLANLLIGNQVFNSDQQVIDSYKQGTYKQQNDFNQVNALAQGQSIDGFRDAIRDCRTDVFDIIKQRLETNYNIKEKLTPLLERKAWQQAQADQREALLKQQRIDVDQYKGYYLTQYLDQTYPIALNSILDERATPIWEPIKSTLESWVRVGIWTNPNDIGNGITAVGQRYTTLRQNLLQKYGAEIDTIYKMVLVWGQNPSSFINGGQMANYYQAAVKQLESNNLRDNFLFQISQFNQAPSELTFKPGYEAARSYAKELGKAYYESQAHIEEFAHTLAQSQLSMQHKEFILFELIAQSMAFLRSKNNLNQSSQFSLQYICVLAGVNKSLVKTVFDTHFNKK